MSTLWLIKEIRNDKILTLFTRLYSYFSDDDTLPQYFDALYQKISY